MKHHCAKNASKAVVTEIEHTFPEIWQAHLVEKNAHPKQLDPRQTSNNIHIYIYYIIYIIYIYKYIYIYIPVPGFLVDPRCPKILLSFCLQNQVVYPLFRLGHGFNSFLYVYFRVTVNQTLDNSTRKSSIYSFAWRITMLCGGFPICS